VGNGNGVSEGPNHFYSGARGHDLEQPAFAQLFVILQMRGKGIEARRR
jgi:hypothetical protein